MTHANIKTKRVEMMINLDLQTTRSGTAGQDESISNDASIQLKKEFKRSKAVRPAAHQINVRFHFFR